MPNSKRELYQLKITLEGMKPPIWRRIIVPKSIKLPELHLVIQAAMGWTNMHAHQFVCGHDDYGPPDPDLPTRAKSETRVQLGALLSEEDETLIYEYDFGDSWLHLVKLERLLEPDAKHPVPRCVGGGRACPPEDCGGLVAYQELLTILANPGHEQHAEIREWLPMKFDPEAFDLAAVNKALGELRL